MYATQDWGRGDLTHFNYPLHEIYGNALKKFELPFFTNKIYSGFELGAEGQVGMFYLPNLILYFFLPNYTAYSFSFLFVSFLSSAGVYTFCRIKKLSLLPSLFAAITFSYSFFISCHFVHMNMVQAFSLVPWLFVFIERLKDKFSKKMFLLFVFTVTQIIFTGHPQVTLYAFCAYLMYALLESFSEKRYINIGIILFGTFIGVLISLPQLLATWELSRTSPSSSLESAQNSIELFPYTVRDFLYFLYPFPFGDPSRNTYTILQKDGIFWENNTFSGFIAVVLFIFAVFKKNKKIQSLLILFLTFTLFSMGWLYIFYYLPPFSLFRLPQRSLVIVIFSYSVIAGYGLSFVSSRFKKYTHKILCTAIFLQFITLSFLGNTYNSPQPKSSFLETPKSAEFLKQKNAKIYSIGGVKLWEKVYREVSHGWNGDNGKAILATKNILDPNRNAAFHVSSLDGYAKLVPLRTLAYLSLVRKGVIENTSEILINSESAKLLGLSSVTHVISAKKINSSNFEMVYSYSDNSSKTTYYVYKNILTLPLIKSAKSLQALPKKGKITAKDIASDSVAYGETFFTEGESKKFNNDVIIKNQRVTDQKISFDTSSSSESFVVISESYSKNLAAYINNKETSIIPININSLGINLPPGINRVEIVYLPKPFLKGIVFTVSGMLLLTVFLALSSYKKIKSFIT